MIRNTTSNQHACGVSKEEDDDDEDFQLPGFRFHPTDEELVGFYLRRKIQKKPIRIELIKHVDIYKYDPWDLPKPSKMENESYFFCKRGRKYRNSIRPNRVTGSGFWKATGIDKPVYSDEAELGHDNIIGLKKTLVYYRGSAGKGTKTDWMMHEFRLPTNDNINVRINHNNSSNNDNNKSISTQEAEVWTLCRIFKRNVSSRKYTPDCRELASNKRTRSHSIDTSSSNFDQEGYISFGDPDKNIITRYYSDEKYMVNHTINERNVLHVNQLSSMSQQSSYTAMPASNPNFSNVPEVTNQFVAYGNWDELRSVVEFGLDPSPL